MVDFGRAVKVVRLVRLIRLVKVYRNFELEQKERVEKFQKRVNMLKFVTATKTKSLFGMEKRKKD